MSDLFYIDTQPQTPPLSSTINLNTEICSDDDRQMVADLVTQLQPLSAPMKADHPSGNGLGENCSNHPHHGGCQNLDCTSIMNVNWNHRKGKGNRQLGLLRVRSQQIYFCSPVCAYTLGYEMEDLKLGFHMTLPKTYRELIYYLQTDFCCKLHFTNQSVFSIYLLLKVKAMVRI